MSEQSDPLSAPPESEDAPESKSPWRIILEEFLSNKRAVVALILLVLIGLSTIFVPMLSPHSYKETFYIYDGASPPDKYHWFGIDTNYRDLLVRCFVGGQISFAVGFLATGVALFIGISWGAIAGYMGGWVDMIMMRIVDILYGLPYMMLVIVAMAVLGEMEGFHEFLKQFGVDNPSFLLVFVILGFFSWLTMSRIVRGEVLSLKETEFVMAANALGANSFTIITRHIIPNLLGPVIVYTTLTVPRVMLAEAFLSFLGLGISAPMTSWGKLISEGALSIAENYNPWWLYLFPGLLFSTTLYCLNTVGDALRDAFNARAE